MLDLGELPPEYLVPAGSGHYKPKGMEEQDEDASADVWSGTYHERGARLYNEWDFRRRSYRKGWCVMRELTVEPKVDGFVQETLAKYSRHLLGLRKTFEALRGEDKRLRKEPYGDEVDIDALVEARADAHRGLEMSDRLFTRLDRVERNSAVMFMADMSGSTRGWINKAEREALLLLCEALETLGDRYAIYGFSGMTRKRCETYRITSFDDAYGEDVQGRIAGIESKDYTRMGVAIRHLSKILNQIEAKTRVLVTLSDGKPDDYSDEYRSEYGIEDTRRALIEAKRSGIHPFCITIDKEGQDYLPHMYGTASYTIVDAVETLPYKVSEIYRRLTA
jgi:nitric oxide reductase NorD protein